MKQLIICITAFCLAGTFSAVQAQTKDSSKSVKKAAERVGHKTAEAASKAKSAVVDQVYKGKCGPNGQTIYIDNKDKYYWIDKKGRKQYIDKSQLRDKKD